MKRIEISNRKVGKDQPCFVIAEAGVNHDGDVNLAKKLIEIASEAKADAVKFQTWITDEIVTRTTPKPRYQRETTSETESQYEMLKRLELSEEEFTYLAGYAKDIGIIFLSTPEGKRCIDFLERLGVPAYKVGSADLNNFPHLEYVAKKKKPIILSTGMASYSEVKEAVDLIRNVGNEEIILLHCTSSYPTRIEDVNLRAMLTLREEFDLPVGYSDHTEGIGVSIAAVALGASVIEKHFTLDKKLPGPDHKASLEPIELKRMVKGIRLAETKVVAENNLRKTLRRLSEKVPIEKHILENVDVMLGSRLKKPVESECEMIKMARKYIVAKQYIPPGTTIHEDMLALKRSGGGLEPKLFHKVVGKKAKEAILEDEIITLGKLE